MKPVIVIVEDNERNRKLLRTILEFRGYEVHECDDGEPSLELVRAKRPVLVLMDIALPRMDGITALERLRADPETAGVPVVAVTASVTTSERARVEAAGFNAYISKPIDIASFGDMIDSLLGRAGAAA